VLDSGRSTIRKLLPDGSWGPSIGDQLGDSLSATAAQMNDPRAVAVGPRGLYVADGLDLRIRRVNPNGTITSVVGGQPPCVRFFEATDGCSPYGTPADVSAGSDFPLALNGGQGLAASSTNLLAFVDYDRVYVLNDSSAPVTVFPQSSNPLTIPPGYVQAIAGQGSQAVPITGTEPAVNSSLLFPSGLAFFGDEKLFVSEQLANRIDMIDLRTGEISVLAGAPYTIPPNIGPFPTPTRDTWLDGPTNTAHFYQPGGLAVAPDGSIYVADIGNERIRKISFIHECVAIEHPPCVIDFSQGDVITVAGNGVGAGFHGDGGPALAADLVYPTDVGVLPDGSLVVLDWGNERIRRIDTNGIIRTFAGSGPSRVERPCGTTVPCGHYSGDGGPAPQAQLYFPFFGANFLTVGPDGAVYVADSRNNRIRAIRTPSPVQLITVVSRATHANAGTFDVDLTSGNGIECRSGGANGNYTLVFSFTNPLTSVRGASVTSGTGSVANSSIDSSDAHNYIVNLTGVTNGQRVTVDLTNVADSAGNTSSSILASMGVLLGDVNSSGRVDAADVSVVRQQTLQPLDATNFREDINLSGRIDAADVSIARQQTLTSLP
jgi:sugar lactone lactonase YvrE